MAETTASLLPVFVVIALGFALSRTVFQDREMWRLLERLNYFVLFPALLISTLANAQLGPIAIWPLILTLFTGLFTLVAALAFARPYLGLSGPQYASVFQGAVRWNGFVALATVEALFGAQGVAVAALVIAVLVPTINILSVVVLNRYRADGPAPLAILPGVLIRNPLILACLTGIALNLTLGGLSGPVGVTAEVLADAALAFGLLSVGAGLSLTALKGREVLIAGTSLLKLVAMPIIFALWAWVFGVEGLTRTVVIVCGAVPGATSAYILAKQLGGDADLMAGLVTASTLGAIFTMPLMLLWLT